MDLVNGLCVLCLKMLMFNINIKKNRLDNEYSSYWLNCRLGHSNEIRITMFIR
jgi:hypothetical protein